MKKEGIQTRNRKISTKLKKSSVCRDPRFDPSNFKFFDTAAAAAAAYSGSFGQMHTFGGVHPHHPAHHPHMAHHLASSTGFAGAHPMLPTAHPHHPIHASHSASAAAASGSGALTLGLNHPNMVHAMG